MSIATRFARAIASPATQTPSKPSRGVLGKPRECFDHFGGLETTFFQIEFSLSGICRASRFRSSATSIPLSVKAESPAVHSSLSLAQEGNSGGRLLSLRVINQANMVPAR